MANQNSPLEYSGRRTNSTPGRLNIVNRLILVITQHPHTALRLIACADISGLTIVELTRDIERAGQ